jgi:hypothetical protein
MISLKTMAAAAAAMAFIGCGAALAKDTPKHATTPVVHTPQSIACSKEADARGLHGKERKKFRAACKKGHMPEAPKKS